ncbi:interleukin 15, like [Syngnathoides biaculeatus]|uniref:interleukin 15, like n=1 Tax=Syngnathoides biaculeatus TaxID=300417 RepID=UPI002ADD98A8|nr:interleukin 15, like [Syngnathoides biaculeatus]XP_061683538.1 interleukin 15, like [Syngnathoides biaculeatus]
MLRGRPALLTLWCLACLACLLREQARAFSRDALRQVETLRRQDAASCPGCKLYTPSVTDYTMCPRDTLKCFSAEVRVLLAEWEGSQRPGLERALESFADHLGHSGRQCAPCELHPEEDVPRFLEQLYKTLQAFNNLEHRKDPTGPV